MNEITAESYSIHIKPDISTFTFTASAHIHLHAAKPVIHIVLNALDLAIDQCSMKREDRMVACSFQVPPDAEELIITLPDETEGPIHLLIDYQGDINDRMAGFYRSAYGPEEQRQYIAVTQFQESDARRAFPCLDHPRQKAVFNLTMTVDQDVVALSNTGVAQEIPLPDGKKQIQFQPTPKMSTYLVFFGMGNFQIQADHADPRVRMVTLPDREFYGGYGLDFGRKSLKFCEDYFAIPYPLPKLDLIAVPDFAFGAMENWGAVTFRENLLLHYPEITSKSGEERICEVIAHEIVHQWFGNLVTPSDWRYLWLNESFATYFGFGVVDHYHPEWDTWDQFVNTMTLTAMERDALHETFSIEIPGGDHVVINAATAPIIYNKGGSILRQIEGYIHTDNFKKGLQSYLKTHEYACADSHHLWEAFESVSDKPVTRIVKNWIEQPGYPILTVDRNGDHLMVSQQRFTYLPHEAKQTWLVPVNIRLFDTAGRSRLMSVLLEDAFTKVHIGNNITAYKVNDGQTGFFRVEYLDESCFETLGQFVREKTLSSMDRWGLENDLFARVKRGDVAMVDYLRFLENYTTEDAFLPLSSIAGNLHHAYLLANSKVKERISAVALPLFETVLDAIGLEPKPEEGHILSVLRDKLLWPAVLYGSDTIKAFAKDRFKRLCAGNPIHPDIQKSIMQAGAAMADEEAFDWLKDRFVQSESEHERMNLLTAMGCVRTEDTMNRALEFVLESVPDRNRFIPIISASMNPNITPYLWNWYQTNLKALEKSHPLLYERVIAGIIPVGGLSDPDGVRAFFDDYLKKDQVPKDTIRMSLERMEVNGRLRIHLLLG